MKAGPGGGAGMWRPRWIAAQGLWQESLWHGFGRCAGAKAGRCGPAQTHQVPLGDQRGQEAPGLTSAFGSAAAPAGGSFPSRTTRRRGCAGRQLPAPAADSLP